MTEFLNYQPLLANYEECLYGSDHESHQSDISDLKRADSTMAVSSCNHMLPTNPWAYQPFPSIAISSKALKEEPDHLLHSDLGHSMPDCPSYLTEIGESHISYESQHISVLSDSGPSSFTKGDHHVDVKNLVFPIPPWYNDFSLLPTQGSKWTEETEVKTICPHELKLQENSLTNFESSWPSDISSVAPDTQSLCLSPGATLLEESFSMKREENCVRQDAVDQDKRSPLFSCQSSSAPAKCTRSKRIKKERLPSVSRLWAVQKKLKSTLKKPRERLGSVPSVRQQVSRSTRSRGKAGQHLSQPSLSEEDMKLMELKALGLKYKEIKKKGNFKVTESTLRGRFRTLVKEKHQRVRRPEWTDIDIQLLYEGIQLYGSSDKSNSARKRKIPWLKVAQHIGLKGSYEFGPATVSKKWKHLIAGRRGALDKTTVH